MGGNLAYENKPWDEMINGQVIMMSPRPSINHNRISGNIYRVFANFLDGKTCEAFGDGVDLYLTDKDRFIPDGMIVCHRNIIQKDGIHGTPDLVVEILSPSTARNDRKHKKDVYEAAGVREYWIVEPETKSVEVYLLRDGKLELDEIYSIYPDYLLNKMTDDEKAAIITKFHCSLFPNLTISLDDIFSNTF